MTRIIMCGCNGAMGRMITGIVNEDAEAEIVAGIDNQLACCAKIPSEEIQATKYKPKTASK